MIGECTTFLPLPDCAASPRDPTACTALADAMAEFEDDRAAGRWSSETVYVELGRHLSAITPSEKVTVLIFGSRHRVVDTAVLREARDTLRAQRTLVLVTDEHRPQVVVEPSGPTDAADEPDLERLSPRELEIANEIALGLTNRQIARRLELSPKTVETHIGRIFSKLMVSSRAEVAYRVGALRGGRPALA